MKAFKPGRQVKASHVVMPTAVEPGTTAVLRASLRETAQRVGVTRNRARGQAVRQPFGNAEGLRCDCYHEAHILFIAFSDACPAAPVMRSSRRVHGFKQQPHPIPHLHA
jgi:hypothetical protein